MRVIGKRVCNCNLQLMMKNILQKIGSSSNWVIFSLFALSIFIKCVFFHYACFNYVAFSSLWQEPLEFLAFYFAKLLPALFFASFVFYSNDNGGRLWLLLLSIYG